MAIEYDVRPVDDDDNLADNYHVSTDLGFYTPDDFGGLNFYLKHLNAAEREGASGTGLFAPFLRMNGDATLQGFNTSVGISNGTQNTNHLDIDFSGNNELGGDGHTRAFLLGDIPIVYLDLNEDGTAEAYYQLNLDINENNANEVSLEELQIYTSTGVASLAKYQLGGATDASDKGDAFLAADGFVKRFDLDINGDAELTLRDDSNGQGGNDYYFFIPLSAFGNAKSTDFITLYSQFGPTPADNAGFAEWNTLLAAHIVGLKFYDRDANGTRDADGADNILGGAGAADDEVTLAGFTTYIDLNNNNKLDNGEQYAISDANGAFRFDSLLPDTTYVVREILSAADINSASFAGNLTYGEKAGQTVNVLLPPALGWRESTGTIDTANGGDPFGRDLTVVVGDAGTYNVAVGNFNPINISGTKYLDDEGDGSIVGDFGLGNVTIFIDINGNGENDEAAQYVTVTLANGTWSFTGLGTEVIGKTVNEALPDGYVQTLAVAANGYVITGSATGLNFANFLPEPSIAITKSASVPSDCADDITEVITYTITVENDGQLALTGVFVTDIFEGGAVRVIDDGDVSLEAGEVARQGDTNNDNILSVGETWTYTYTRAVTQADIDSNGNGNGYLTNVAAVEASSTNGFVDDTANASVEVCQDPAITIDKQVVDVGGDGAGGTIDSANDVVTYRVVVTNTGNQTLTNVVVADPLTGLDLNIGSLAPGQVWESDNDGGLTLTYDVEQSDIDDNGGGDGDIDNTATANSDQTDEVDDSEFVPIDQNPAITIDKQVVDVGGDGAGGTIDSAADIVTYRVVVTNTGNQTLTNVVVADPLTGLDLNIGSLAPGQVWESDNDGGLTLTYDVEQSDIDDNGGGDGDIDNTATANSDQTDEVDDSEFVPIDQNPAITIDKQVVDVGGDGAGGTIDSAADIVTYRVVVTNTGNQTLTNVVVADPLTGLDLNIGSLAPGQVWESDNDGGLTLTYDVEQSDIDDNGGGDGDIDNTATANSDQTDEVDDSEFVPIDQNPAITIDKQVVDVGGDGAGGTIDSAADIVTYRVVVTNTGNQTLTNVVVADPLTGLDLNIGSLAPGQVWESDNDGGLTLTYDVEQSDIDDNGGGDGDIDNTATANSDQTDEVDDSEFVPIDQNPAITIDKQVVDVGGDGAGGTIDSAADIVTYRVVVTNTGNQTLTNVVVADPLTGLDLNIGSLAPGQVWESDNDGGLTLTYDVEQSDIDDNGGGDGDIDNTATANSDQTDEVDDSEFVPIDQNPAITIDKQVVDVGGDGAGGTIDSAADIVTYRVVVTNTGNQTLTNVVVADPLTGLDLNIGSLAPGQVWESDNDGGLTLTYDVEQSDIDDNGGGDGDIDNTATANSDQTDEVDDSEFVPIDQNPAITIVKDLVLQDGGDCVDDAKDNINYTISVTNTGNVSLTQLYVFDDFADAAPLLVLGADGIHAAGDLDNDGVFDVGETWVYQAYHEVSQDEIDAGGNYDSDVPPDGINDSLRNEASAIGYTASGETTGWVYDDAYIEVCHLPAIDIDKVGTPPDDCLEADDTISYTYTVTNTGNVALDNVVVEDDKLGILVADDVNMDGFADGDIDKDGLLDLDETWIYHAEYTVTQEDMDTYGGGDDEIENRVTANAVAAVSGVVAEQAFDTEALALCHEYAITLEKYVSVDSTDGTDGTFDDADSAQGLLAVNVLSDVWFQVTLTNGGNTQLTGIDIGDVNTSNGQAGILFDLMVNGALTANAVNNFAATLDGDTDGDGNLDVDETWTITYKQAFDAGQHINTATVITDEGVTDSDDAYYYSLTDCGPGVGTPGFWKNLGAQFWDGNANNQTKVGDNFPVGELSITVNGVKGLLLGDYNMNGLTDAGENTLFISLTDGRKLIDASMKQQQDGKWMLGRDMVASWLNYLAGNAIDFGDNTTGGFNDPFSPKAYLNDAIEWLKEYGDLNDDGVLDSTTGPTFTAKANAIATSSVKWSSAALDGVTGNDFSASQAHSALDYYNNTGDVWNPVTMQYVEFACDRDDIMQMHAVSLV